ncbi:hypothetical protein LINGRAHAP2_LOCUS36425, partial [Linum grandiflorum]
KRLRRIFSVFGLYQNVGVAVFVLRIGSLWLIVMCRLKSRFQASLSIHEIVNCKDRSGDLSATMRWQWIQTVCKL